MPQNTPNFIDRMAKITRMDHDTIDDDDVRMAVDEHDSGVSIDGTPKRDFEANKKRRQSRLFDTTFDR
jgi:hypothetical protein